MAADATVYLNNGAKNTVKLDGVAQYDSWIALKLLAYGSNIKTLFYLDGVMVIDNGAGSIGFIGYVWLDGTNIAYHADARKSKTIIKNSLGREAVLLNDGGLNTLGDASIPAITDYKVGAIKAPSQAFVSSYYANSTRYGLKYSTNGTTWTEILLGTSLASKASTSFNVDHDTDALEKGNAVIVFGFIINEEGEYRSAEKTYTALAYDRGMGNGSYGSAACGGVGTPTTYYTTRKSVSIGSTIFTDLACIYPAANGYYSFGGKFYKQITADGNPASAFNIPTITMERNCGDWETSDPAYIPPSTTYEYYGYDNFAAPSACLAAGSGPLKKLYYVGTSYYTNSGLTTKATAGWYSDSVGWIRINGSGTKINEGSC